jgi:hypothetical protein
MYLNIYVINNIKGDDYSNKCLLRYMINMKILAISFEVVENNFYIFVYTIKLLNLVLNQIRN